MKLFYSPFHTFVHKILVTAHECGLWDDIDFIAAFPFKNLDGEDQGEAYSIQAINPLSKVPTLATDTGQVIFGSQAVCEYLDANSKAHKLYPDPGPARWDAVTRLATADTIFEGTVQMVAEQWQEPEHWNHYVFERMWPKFIRSLDWFDAEATKGWDRFDIGHAAMLHAISYLGFRAEFYEAKDPIYPNFDWREGRSALSAWFDEAVQRPSVQSHYKNDFIGDTSAQRLQAAVEEVLALQKAEKA
ncbi:glutathione S-transferase family protein [Erythrobacter sp. W53]|uniref:glutathione S-transferase family protein n=1 Tax=Erythrobacter sp. W53 TaxID=3425947 RepID=UPI003D767A26